MVAHSGLLTVMERAARKAAPKLRRDFNEVSLLQVTRKGPADFVSQADQRVEKELYDELKRARPDWGFLGEETRSDLVASVYRRVDTPLRKRQGPYNGADEYHHRHQGFNE